MMPMPAALRVCVCLTVLPILSAQKHATEPDVLLAVSTTLHEPIWKLIRWLPIQIDADLPELEIGDTIELVYTSDRRLLLERGKPAPHLVKLSMRPARLKPLLHAEAGMLTGIFRALTFTFFVNKYRAEPRYVARAIHGVANFPLQVDSLNLLVEKREGFENGLKIELDVTPVKGSWFARVLQGIEPSEKGAHLLRTPTSALSVAAAIEGPAKSELVAPFAGILANLRGQSKVERAAFRELVSLRTEQFGGSFSLLIDGPGRYVRLVGLRNPAKFASRAQDAIGIAFDTRRVGRASVTIDEHVPEALEASSMRILHREEDLLEAVTSEPEIELTTFSGVVEDFSVKVRWPKDGVEVARLVDRIQQRRLRRIPLVDRALVMAELNFGKNQLLRIPRTTELLEELGRLVDTEDLVSALENLPEQVRIAVYKHGKKGAERLSLQIFTR